jgi:hypothetical protein
MILQVAFLASLSSFLFTLVQAGPGRNPNSGFAPVSKHFNGVSLLTRDEWTDTNLWSYKYNGSDTSNIFELWDNEKYPLLGDRAPKSQIPLNGLELCSEEEIKCSSKGVWIAVSNPSTFLPGGSPIVFDIGNEIQLKFAKVRQ